MKQQDKKIFKERIKSFFPQATDSGVEQLMNLLVNCCCIDLCTLTKSNDVQFTSMLVVGNTVTITLTINGVPVTQSIVLPADIVTTMTNTKPGNLIGTYTNEAGVAVAINETISIIGTPTLTNNILTIPFTNETGVTSNVTVDLSSLATDVSIQGITYNSTTNTWTITQTDGSTNTITWNDILTDVDFCPAVKACETTTTIVNNGNGTATFTNELGVSTTFPIGGVTIVDNGDGTYTTTLADGTIVVIGDTSTTNYADVTTLPKHQIGNFINELGTIIPVYESVSTITPIVSGHGIATYQDETGTTTTIQETITEYQDNTLIPHNIGRYRDEVGIFVDINENLTSINNTVVGHKIADYTNELGTVVNIDETVTSITDNGDGTFTYINENGISNTININDLLITNTELFTVNAGTTNVSTDNSLGEQVITVGDILHFWANNGSINFNVQAGSVVVDISTEASIIPYTPTSPITSTNVQGAIDALANNTHVPVTTIDSPTINFTQSGVDFQTVTADFVGANTATIGQIPTSDGNGNITWTTPTVTVLADNGLTETSGTIELGGTLIHDTFIDDTTANTNKLTIGTTTPINSFTVISETENRIATTVNDYNAYLRTMSNYNRLEVSSDINPEIARVDTTAVIGQATTNISAYDGTETAQTNYNAQSGNTYATTIVTNGIDTNTLTITATTLQSSIHPNTRDDSGINMPINFLYTDSSGIVQSAPTTILNGNNWLLNGNAGTDGGVTDFLGTTDAVDLVLKTNNTPVSYFSGDGLFRTSIGDAASNVVSGQYSISIGTTNYSLGLAAITIGEGNEANGDHSMTLGLGSVADGIRSLAVQGATTIGNNSFAFGQGVSASSYREIAFGDTPVTYIANSATSWDVNDRLFSIGNGQGSIQNNALTIWKDGRAVMNTDATNTTPIQNTWFGINGTLAQNYNHIRTDNTLAAFSTEHTPSGNYAILGSNAGNSGLVINNTKQFVFATTASTSATNLTATNTIGNYSNSGFLFGGGGVAASTVDVSGTLGLSNIRINTANPILNTNNTVYHFTGGASGTINMAAHLIDNRTIVLTNYSGVSLTLSHAVRTGSATTTTTLPDNTSVTIAYDGVEFFQIG